MTRTGKATDRYREAVWRSDLSASLKLAALAMCEFMDHTTLDDARPGTALIARRTGLSQSTVKRCLRSLVAAGWLIQTQRGGSAGGRKLASIYRGSIPKTGVTMNPVENENRGHSDTGPGTEPGSPRHGNRGHSEPPPSLREGRPGRRIAPGPKRAGAERLNGWIDLRTIA